MTEAKKFLPFHDIKVAELDPEISGAYCGMQLNDAGAEVIKVEPFPFGDDTRKMGDHVGTESALFLSLNRGKKSLCVSFEKEETKEILCELGKKVDIFLISSQWTKKFGLSYELLKGFNPSIIYCSLSVFGERGPYKDRVATELELQGMAGYQWFLGKLGDPPVRLGGDICETVTGMQSFLAIMAALFCRKRSGIGQEIKVSKLRTAAAFAYYLPAFENPDDWLGYMVSGPTDEPEVGYKTADRPILWGFGLSTPEKSRQGWSAFCKKVDEFSWMLEDPYWIEHGAQMLGLGRDAQENKPIFEATFEKLSSKELIEIVDECGGVAAPINTYETLFKDPQIELLELVDEIEHPQIGRMRMLRPPWQFSSTPTCFKSPAPFLGQHTDGILESLGYSRDRILNLKERKVVKGLD